MKIIIKQIEQFVRIVLIYKKRRNYGKISEKWSVNVECINNRTLLIGPSFSGKTYLILKMLSRLPDRDFYIITGSPPQHYFNPKIKITENGKENKPLKEYENAITVNDDFQAHQIAKI